MHPISTRLTEIVSAGLVSGIGHPEPGKLCIEAAICLAMGEPHGDKPSCVAVEDRAYAIRINDAAWPSREARAEALLPLGLAQLGTAGTDRSAWVKRLVEGTIRRVVPLALEAAAKANPKHAESLLAAAKRCRDEGTREAAQAARWAATDATTAATDAATAAAAAYAAAAAAYATDATTAATDAATAAAAAAYAAAAAAYAADDAADTRLAILRESVAVALDAYRAEGRS